MTIALRYYWLKSDGTIEVISKNKLLELHHSTVVYFLARVWKNGDVWLRKGKNSIWTTRKQLSTILDWECFEEEEEKK